MQLCCTHLAPYQHALQPAAPYLRLVQLGADTPCPCTSPAAAASAAGTAGILAVGGSKPSVVATADGLIGVRKVMQVNLTADHRIVYGADAAEFLQTLKAVMESPDQLLL